MLTGFSSKIRIDRKASPTHATIAGYPHYFPLSLLPDDFWAAMAVSSVVRVTDGQDNEYPYHLAEINVVDKNGSLFFKADKADENISFWIQYGTTTEFNHVSGPYYYAHVWDNTDGAYLLRENPADVFFFNYKNGTVGTATTNNGSYAGNWVQSKLEMKANKFIDARDNLISFGANNFNTFSTPRTFFFLFKPTKATFGIEHLFGNWRESFVGQQPWRVVLASGPSLGILLGESGLGWTNLTQEDQLNDLTLNEWHMVAIKYDFGPGGIQLDMNGIARVMEDSEGIWPSDSNSATRTIGGVSTNASDCELSMIVCYDGSLDKAQRDIWFDNWFSPSEFWSVVESGDSVHCFESPMEKNICITSPLKKRP